MRLFNEIVLAEWNSRRSEAKRLRGELEAVARRKRGRVDRVDDAFLHGRSIDRETYERQRDQLREELSLAEWNSPTLCSTISTSRVCYLLTNAARLWSAVALSLPSNSRARLSDWPSNAR